jgi:hypothetical protein
MIGRCFGSQRSPIKVARQQVRKRFFLKKEAKTFAIGVRARWGKCNKIKVFWFFFSKKNPSFLSRHRPLHVGKASVYTATTAGREQCK